MATPASNSGARQNIPTAYHQRSDAHSWAFVTSPAAPALTSIRFLMINPLSASKSSQAAFWSLARAAKSIPVERSPLEQGRSAQHRRSLLTCRRPFDDFAEHL